MENRKASDLSRRVADELWAAQRRLGFLWADVETATGIPHTTMYRMLNAKVDIPVAKLMLICEAVGIDVADIIEDATRHMPDNYLQSLLVSPPMSPTPSTVTPSKSTDWDTYEGKKAADVDNEVRENPTP